MTELIGPLLLLSDPQAMERDQGEPHLLTFLADGVANILQAFERQLE